MPALLDEIPAHVRSILIFGGTFDPPHNGHILLPAIAREKLNIDWLLYIPAASPPLKQGPIASEQQRLDMLVCALQDSQHTTISTIEYARGGTSYTIDTLNAFCVRYPDISMRLLIGADQAVQFHQWKHAREIIALAEPVVMVRDVVKYTEKLLDEIVEFWSSEELAQWKSWCIEVPSIECSSTHIRDLLQDPDTNQSRLRNCLPNDLMLFLDVTNPYTHL